MLIIKFPKLLIFVVFFLLNLYIVLAGYPATQPTASGCKEGAVGVKVGDFCYDCDPISDGVCPNDLSDGVCTPAKPDADCPNTLACSQRTTPETCVSGCTWCAASNGAKTLVGTQCKDGDKTTCEYKCVAGARYGDYFAQCNDGQISKNYGAIYPDYSCAEITETCSDQCTFLNSYKDVSCGTLYTNACDDGSTKTDLCGNNCKRNVAPYTTSGSEAGMCNDGIDNDCDGEKDWDTAMSAPDSINGLTRGPQKGDNNCAVGVTGIFVSKDNPWLGEGVEVTCTATVSGINSVDAFIDTEKCNYIENSWSGNNVKFLCLTNSLGNKIVKCTIDKTKSYQSQSGSEQTKTINVIQGDCSSLTLSQCNNAPGNRCELCNKCSGNLYSGGDNRCVAKGSCSYVAKKDFCGAQCDATVGCSGVTICKDECYQGTYRDYEDSKQWCDLNNGQCKDGSCTLYKEVVTDVDKDGFDTQCDNDCNDNDANINSGAKEICDGIDNDCNPATADGSGEIAPDNSNQLGVCKNTKKICSNGAWVDNYPNSYQSGKELTCNDALDNDCNGITDCADTNCKGSAGPNGLTCCQVNDAVTGCPADGAEGFTSCVNDNTRKGAIGSFTCVQNECKPSTKDTTSSCTNGGCCFPGGGTATCLNPGKTSVIDVDNDQSTEDCSAGNWIGADCQGDKCTDDGAPHANYNCATDSDCKGNIGQCGEEICSGSNVCTTQEKTNKKGICETAMPDSYKCAKFFSCSAATNYNCQYAGDSTLCADKYPVSPGRDPYDTACSGNPDFRCNVDVCIRNAVTSNPCCLCYSQCRTAAADPDVAPGSTDECNIAKNYQWTNAQCPFTGG